MGFVFTHKSFLYLNISVSLCGLFLPKSKPISWTESKPDLRKLLPLCWNKPIAANTEWKREREGIAHAEGSLFGKNGCWGQKKKSMESTFTGTVQPFCCSLVCISKQLLYKWIYGCWTSTRCSVLPQKWVFFDCDGLVLLKSLMLGTETVCICAYTHAFLSCWKGQHIRRSVTCFILTNYSSTFVKLLYQVHPWAPSNGNERNSITSSTKCKGYRPLGKMKRRYNNIRKQQWTVEIFPFKL